MVQLVPLLSGTEQSLGRATTANHELVFQAAKLPPFGHKSYYVVKTASMVESDQRTTTITKPRAGETTTITNEVNTRFLIR